jgi:hypothetical protein
VLGILAALSAGVPIVCANPAPAGALEIVFAATDLDDAGGPGGDWWRYTYQVLGDALLQDQGFSVAFDPSLYAALADATPAHPDWDVLILQPDPLLPDAGLFDALALADGSASGIGFAVTFVWLGGAGSAPGPQPFTVNQFDSEGALVATLQEGLTVVPEPASALLVLVGAVGLAARPRSGRRSS